MAFQTTERKFKEAKKFIKEISDENVKLRAELNKRLVDQMAESEDSQTSCYMFKYMKLISIRATMLG